MTWKTKLIIILAALIAILVMVGYFLWKNAGNKHYTLKELVEKVREMKQEGYDVYKAEYYLLSARYYFALRDKEKAAELFNKAVKALDQANLIPEAQEPKWNAVPSTADITQVPTTWDFVPLGSVFVKTDNGYIVYPRNDRSWKLSCFIIAAMGWTQDGEDFAYQGRLPLVPEENPFKPRIYFKGKWTVPNIVFAGPLYYDDGEKFGLPTVYQFDLSGKYMQYLSYDEEHRLWIHVIKRVDGDELLEMRMKAQGAPMWLGDWRQGRMLIHGVYPHEENFDLWGGFWDMGPMNVTLTVGGKTYEIRGFMIFDRASHRVMHGEAQRRAGPPLAFTCMVIWQENLTIMVTHTVNPSPADPRVSFEHQLRINLPRQSLNLSTTDFTLVDSGGIQPVNFTLSGKLPNGCFNLTGTVVMFWPEKWVIGKKTWWNPDAYFAWGRAFSKWKGIVVVDNTAIKVDAWGIGEYTRYNPTLASGYGAQPLSSSCWGRWGGNCLVNATGS